MPMVGINTQGLSVSLVLSLPFLLVYSLTICAVYFADPRVPRPVQVIGTVYRDRYYFVWSMGHCSLAFAGLDFLQWDSKTAKGVWNRCRNAQPLKVEFCDSSRLLTKYWNSTTGNFLRRCVCVC